ncbi:hypothetical protein SRHO_G00273730 [Serrasalmus rhombeus]
MQYITADDRRKKKITKTAVQICIRAQVSSVLYCGWPCMLGNSGGCGGDGIEPTCHASGLIQHGWMPLAGFDQVLNPGALASRSPHIEGDCYRLPKHLTDFPPSQKKPSHFLFNGLRRVSRRHHGLLCTWSRIAEVSPPSISPPTPFLPLYPVCRHRDSSHC